MARDFGFTPLQQLFAAPLCREVSLESET